VLLPPSHIFSPVRLPLCLLLATRCVQRTVEHQEREPHERKRKREGGERENQGRIGDLPTDLCQWSPPRPPGCSTRAVLVTATAAIDAVCPAAMEYGDVLGRMGRSPLDEQMKQRAARRPPWSPPPPSVAVTKNIRSVNSQNCSA
jgi:hypothetical protein